ncbi:MAG: YdcF family protein [Oscillospiraceae bacterium]|nr:YdcF family protein [Oscillospiraceae bacterium]
MRRFEKVCCILAALCVLLGALLRFVWTAVRFTGFLLWCAAGALAVYALLRHWSRTRRWALWCRRMFLVLLAAGLLLFTALEAWVISWSRTDWDTPVEAVVVLGAGVNGRTPSLSLLVRLEAALEYVRDKPGVPIIVTGAQGPGEDISEARCMADWLIARGVEPARVVLEEQAADTMENVRFSKALLAELGVPAGGSVAVVSSDYHLCRAAWMWGGGMVPVAAHMPARYFPLTANYYVREAFGLAAAIVFGI